MTPASASSFRCRIQVSSVDSFCMHAYIAAGRSDSKPHICDFKVSSCAVTQTGMSMHGAKHAHALHGMQALPV